MGYWRHVGIGGRNILAYAHVNPHDRALVRTAINTFGGLFVGLDLPKRALDQRVWSVPRRRSERDAKGSWRSCGLGCGIHPEWPCVRYMGAYAKDELGLVDTYVQQVCFAVIAPRWMLTHGRTRHGFDLPRLERDLAAVTS